MTLIHGLAESTISFPYFPKSYLLFPTHNPQGNDENKIFSPTRFRRYLRWQRRLRESCSPFRANPLEKVASPNAQARSDLIRALLIVSK